MILLAFSSNSSKLSGLSPIWYILITVFSPEAESAAFLLLPERFPQAARPAAKATTLADAKAYFFQFFMTKTPFFIFKLINNIMILTSRKGSLEMRNDFSRQVLFFHTTDSQTFYKVALEEWIQNRDWKGCDHNHGHTTCFFWKSNSQLTR